MCNRDKIKAVYMEKIKQICLMKVYNLPSSSDIKLI